jgi:enterochelin esterase-like enzyme
MLKKRLFTILFTAAVAVAVAQPPAPPAEGGGGAGGRGAAGAAGRGAGGPGGGRNTRVGSPNGTPYTALVSPEVHPDRTVTFRFRAPNATQVDVTGEIVQGAGAGRGGVHMTKGDDGIWTATLGPLAPEIYVYNFSANGITVADPANPAAKPGPPGFTTASLVEIPGDGPLFYDARPAPHGEVREVLYQSKPMGVTRVMLVYTPPGYEQSKAKYPVFYLLHGNGEAYTGWMMAGRANIILDNLIADKKAEPMIVVMPQGHALQAPNVEPLVRLSGETEFFTKRFEPDLLQEIIPLVERTYRVKADADHRAIAGLSMGGGQSLSIGLDHPDLFHYVLGFSGAVGGQYMYPDQVFANALSKPEVLNAKLRLLWIGCGKQDFLYQANVSFVKTLKDKNVKVTFHETEGSHVYTVWRHYLNETAPLLFKAGGKK